MGTIIVVRHNKDITFINERIFSRKFLRYYSSRQIRSQSLRTYFRYRCTMMKETFFSEKLYD